MFEELVDSIQEDATKAVFSIKMKKEEDMQKLNISKEKIVNMSTNNAGSSEPEKKEPVRVGKKIGRNEPCPCGSGKKYKNCCGK